MRCHAMRSATRREPTLRPLTPRSDLTGVSLLRHGSLLLDGVPSAAAPLPLKRRRNRLRGVAEGLLPVLWRHGMATPTVLVRAPFDQVDDAASFRTRKRL
jgi:hypothetical protein